jgi:cell division protein FtsA
MEQAEMAVLSTVHAAEQMAGETIHEVVLNLSGGYPASQTVGVRGAIGRARGGRA